MTANSELVASGLALLRNPLSLFVCQGIENAYGDAWWTEGVLETLAYEKLPTADDVRRQRKLPESGTVEECARAIDVSVCLLLLTKHWARIFSSGLSRDYRGWAFELVGVRNSNKHLGGVDHPSDFAWRALDTMIRLCNPLDADVANELLALRSLVDLSAYELGTGAQTSSTASIPAAGSRVEVDSDSATHPSIAELDDTFNADQVEKELAVSGPDFSGSDLQKMNFSGANLDGADFTDANLTHANLSGAILTRAVFKNTQLGNVNFTDANLTGALFEDTTLSVTRNEASPGRPAFYIARGSDFSGAKLEGATLNFAGSDLQRVNFSGTNLDGADFTDADLTNANLQGCSLRGVNLKGANIKDANTTDVQWT